MSKMSIFLRTLVVAPVLSLLGGCLFETMERDGSYEDILRVAATSDGGALVSMYRAVGRCKTVPFQEGRPCNLVFSWHLAKVSGAEEPIHSWEADLGLFEYVTRLRESTPGRYELQSCDNDSLRIRTFDEQGNKVSDELAGPAPPLDYFGVASLGKIKLADGSVLSANSEAMTRTLTYSDPAGREQWTVPNPVGELDAADGGPAGSIMLGGKGGAAYGPTVVKLDAAGSVVWQRDVGTLPRYMK